MVYEVPVSHDDDAELCSPVSDMVVGNYIKPECPVQIVEGSAYDSRSDVPYVHGFCHIRAGVIYYYGFSGTALRDT